MADSRTDALQELIDLFKGYIHRRSNAGSWWNDSFSWDTMKKVEQIEKNAAAQSATAPIAAASPSSERAEDVQVRRIFELAAAFVADLYTMEPDQRAIAVKALRAYAATLPSSSPVPPPATTASGVVQEMLAYLDKYPTEEARRLSFKITALRADGGTAKVPD